MAHKSSSISTEACFFFSLPRKERAVLSSKTQLNGYQSFARENKVQFSVPCLDSAFSVVELLSVEQTTKENSAPSFFYFSITEDRNT